ncbi:MAG TPA: thermonuclease family protein [Candidatus Sulfotelmatobacter sp.]|nr:thermonuclease family protein [Candidatus Sulfotelmatobacter sp.]
MIALSLLLTAAWTAAEAAEPSALPPALTPQGQARVKALAPDGVLTLEDGRMVKLAGIELPRPLLNGKGAARPQAQDDAGKLLAALTAGQPLILSGEAGPDRWNRLPLQAATASGQWLQAELLSRGLARVVPEADQNDNLLDRLLAAENSARRAHLGLWADQAFRVKAPDEAGQWLDSFQVFEGRVASANLARGYVYVNFGKDRRQDLSLKIPRGVRKALPGDPLGLAGRQVRVRGWIGKGVGPMIEIRHRRQIELLDGVWPARMENEAPRQSARENPPRESAP